MVSAFFASRSRCVYSNLILEDFIFNLATARCGSRLQSGALFAWLNSSAVVMGKNQLSWNEANVPTILQRRMQLARRATGGGCVHHDLGVPLFSFVCPLRRFNRTILPTAVLLGAAFGGALCDGAVPTKKWLTSSLIDSLAVSPSRGDGWVRSDAPPHQSVELQSLSDAAAAAALKDASGGTGSSPDRLVTMKVKKLIGSAFAIRQSAALHHLSVLSDCNFPAMAGLLVPSSVRSGDGVDSQSGGEGNASSSAPPSSSTAQSVGVASVRSPIANLSDVCDAPHSPYDSRSSFAADLLRCDELSPMTALLIDAMLCRGRSLISIAGGGEGEERGEPSGLLHGSEDGRDEFARDGEMVDELRVRAAGCVIEPSMLPHCDEGRRVVIEDPLEFLDALFDSVGGAEVGEGGVDGEREVVSDLRKALLQTLRGTARGAPGPAPLTFGAAWERLSSCTYVVGGGPDFTIGSTKISRYDLTAAAAGGFEVPSEEVWDSVRWRGRRSV